MNVLILNCGSSSLKFALLEAHNGRRHFTGLAERLGTAEAILHWQTATTKQSEPLPTADHHRALQRVAELLSHHNLLADGLAAVGHRVVHGGEQFAHSTRITAEVLAVIEACVPLAPLHNPANLVGIRTAQELFTAVPQVAVFDTAFHQTLPPHAYLYPIPYALYEQNGVRRYGFHGTSHRYVVQRAAELLGRPLTELALVSAHLGNGCSATAVLNGRSVDTTMGLTPLEGLVMGTRSGDIDPSLPQFLHDQLGYDVTRTTNLLNKESGLLGVSGLSNDMRTLLEAAEQGHQRAQTAVDLFCYRLAKSIAALAVPLGRLDGLIFTGGIGEHSAAIRAQVVRQLAILGLAIDGARNGSHGRASHGRISPPEAHPAVLVVPTDEEWMIAQDCVVVLEEGV